MQQQQQQQQQQKQNITKRIKKLNNIVYRESEVRLTFVLTSFIFLFLHL